MACEHTYPGVGREELSVALYGVIYGRHLTPSLCHSEMGQRPGAQFGMTLVHEEHGSAGKAYNF